MGVQILNKDVSLISSITGKAKATIANVGGVSGWAGGGGFQPGDFSFDDVSFNRFQDISTNLVTFNKSGTLYITCVPGSNSLIGAVCYINGSADTLDFWTSTSTAILNIGSLNTGGQGIPMYNTQYAAINISINNTMYFYFYNADGAPFDDLNASINFKITSFTGTEIDSFTINMT